MGITSPEGIVFPVIRSLGYKSIDVMINVVEGFYELLRNESSEWPEFHGDDRELLHQLMNYQSMQHMGMARMLDGSRKKGIQDLVCSWHEWMERAREGEKYCLAISTLRGNRKDTDLSVPNMSALVVGETDTFLVHEPLRMYKKTRVVVGVSHDLIRRGLFQKLTTGDEVRIISNGKEAVVLKE